MKHAIFPLLLLVPAASAFAQSKFPKHEVSINAFRNPSIGLEYHHRQVSMHAGYYTTAFKSGEYTNFLKAGVSCWFLPVDAKKIPSSFYAGASYLRGLTRKYSHKNAAGLEAGFRWMVWKGLNLRMGIIVLAARGQTPRFNPTPGLDYSMPF